MTIEDERKAYSGLETALGYRRTKWEEGRGTIELDLDERHNNLVDRVHGGIYAMLIDDATGYACCWDTESTRRKPGLTLSLTVNFIGAPKTRRIIATGWRTGGGKSTSFAQGEVRDGEGTLLATGEAVYKHFPPKEGAK